MLGGFRHSSWWHCLLSPVPRGLQSSWCLCLSRECLQRIVAHLTHCPVPFDQCLICSNHLSAFQLGIMLWEDTDLQRWKHYDSFTTHHYHLSTVYGAVISKLINCGKGTIICKSSWAQSPLNKIFALLCLLELISYDNEHLSRMIWRISNQGLRTIFNMQSILLNPIF